MERRSDPIDNSHGNNGERESRHPKQHEPSAFEMHDLSDQQRYAKEEPYQQRHQHFGIDEKLRRAYSQRNPRIEHRTERDRKRQENKSEGGGAKPVPLQPFEARNMLEDRPELISPNRAVEEQIQSAVYGRKHQ